MYCFVFILQIVRVSIVVYQPFIKVFLFYISQAIDYTLHSSNYCSLASQNSCRYSS